MMRPPLFICLSAPCVATNAPRRLRSITLIELFERGFLEFLRDCGAGIVDENIELTQSGDRLVDCGLDLVCGRRVGLHGDRLAARAA